MPDTLEILRDDIDRLDAQLIELLGQRFEVCRKIALYKRITGTPMMQTGRVQYVKDRAALHGASHNMDVVFISELYDLLIAEACRLEDLIIESPEGLMGLVAEPAVTF